MGEWSGGQEGWVRCIRGSGQEHKREGVVRRTRGRGQEHKREGVVRRTRGRVRGSDEGNSGLNGN